MDFSAATNAVHGGLFNSWLATRRATSAQATPPHCSGRRGAAEIPLLPDDGSPRAGCLGLRLMQLSLMSNGVGFFVAFYARLRGACRSRSIARRTWANVS